jgi:predicted outer membrane lipoprotein
MGYLAWLICTSLAVGFAIYCAVRLENKQN